MAEIFITEEQRAKCRKVADAFAELYELTDVMVADAGRFGFVRLQWFSEGEGFDSAMAFSDCLDLFWVRRLRSWTMTRYSRRFPKTGRRKSWKRKNISFPGVKMLSVRRQIFFTIPGRFLLK